MEGGLRLPAERLKNKIDNTLIYVAIRCLNCANYSHYSGYIHT